MELPDIASRWRNIKGSRATVPGSASPAERQVGFFVKLNGQALFRVQLAMWASTAILIVGILYNWIPFPLLRYLSVSILVAQVILEFQTDRKLFLTSPLFLMAVFSMFFFSFMLGLAEYTPLMGNPEYAPDIKGSKIFLAIGSNAEKYCAAFSMFSLIAHQTANLLASKITEKEILKESIKFNIFHIFCIFILVLFTTYNNLCFYNDEIKNIIFYKQIYYVSFIIQSFAIASLVRASIHCVKALKFITICTISISIIGMFSVHEGKIPLFIAMVAFLYWYRLSGASFRKIILGMLLSLLLAIAGLHAMQSLRHPGVSLWDRLLTKNAVASVNMFVTLLESKVIWRQTETVYCLQNVIEQNSNQPFVIEKQFFWLQALVPRIIWPAKPSQSMGGEYATEYCGFPGAGIHSSAITLLGQPFINGSFLGLILHTGVLLAGLGGLTWLSRAPFSLASSSVAALLPWLIDFDQDFALLIANAVKFSLVLLPFVFIAGIAERNRCAIWIFAFLKMRRR